MKRSCVLLILATLLLVRVSAVIATTPTDHNTLFQNKQLNAGQRLASTDDRYQFEVQSDGNCVLYDRQSNNVLWASGTSSGLRLTLQPDGNLVMLDSSGLSVWESGTADTGATRLTLDDDGALVLYNGKISAWRLYSITTDLPGALTADKNRGEWTLMCIGMVFYSGFPIGVGNDRAGGMPAVRGRISSTCGAHKTRRLG